MTRPAIIVLGASALPTAERIAQTLGTAEIFKAARRFEADGGTFEDLDATLATLFRDGRAIIGLCASGILIRKLAPLLTDKHAEPPVLAVAEDGSAVVPLLGGHRGANALARTLADALATKAAITTATDVRYGLAIDRPPPGWRLANPSAAKPVSAALLEGRAGLIVEAGDAGWLRSAPFAGTETPRIRVSAHSRAPEAADELVLHPPVLALGVGCARGCTEAELSALVEKTLHEAGLATAAIGLVASIDLKMDEPAVHGLAASLNVPARFFTAPQLAEQHARLASPSTAVFAETGCYGVAEGAALATVGLSGQLIVRKQKSANATCAVALSQRALDPDRVGVPRGRLAIVGIGPGQKSWRTPEVDALIRDSDILIGYRLYLDLLGALADGKIRRDYKLGDETARCDDALALAAGGARVALVCSGDAGIYAMAALAFERLDTGADPAWRRSEIVVSPGISALQAAAARCGAPLGHDFCAISLSDLLTPWAVIETRVRAAAQADFVVALYNPASMTRRAGLNAALEILRAHRPATTPVVLARNLGRDQEHLSVHTLADFDPNLVDMLSLVLIGASSSRRLTLGDGSTRVYTPRGYAIKHFT
ncbi:MAG: precorrin-3B C(17)-methyltransferase [Geminicoccaceae bacterium]